jgi:hypothetical protein
MARVHFAWIKPRGSRDIGKDINQIGVAEIVWKGVNSDGPTFGPTETFARLLCMMNFRPHCKISLDKT